MYGISLGKLSDYISDDDQNDRMDAYSNLSSISTLFNITNEFIETEVCKITRLNTLYIFIFIFKYE